MALPESNLTLRGGKTPRTVIYKSESHKLHQAFNVKAEATIYMGQPVALHTDGTIYPYAGTGIYIGVAVTDSINPAYGAQRDFPIEVTVAVSGHMIVNMSASAALSAGYVAPSGSVVSTRFPAVAAAAANTETHFIALNAASAAGDLVQVLCK